MGTNNYSVDEDFGWKKRQVFNCIKGTIEHQSAINWLIDWLIDWSIDWLIVGIVKCVVHWSIDWLINWTGSFFWKMLLLHHYFFWKKIFQLYISTQNGNLGSSGLCFCFYFFLLIWRKDFSYYWWDLIVRWFVFFSIFRFLNFADQILGPCLHCPGSSHGTAIISKRTSPTAWWCGCATSSSPPTSTCRYIWAQR